MTPAFSTIIHNFEILKHSLLGAVGSDFFGRDFDHEIEFHPRFQ